MKSVTVQNRKKGLASWMQILCALVLAGLLGGLAQAQSSVSLGWDAGTDTNIAGYVLSYGTQSGSYPYQIDAGQNAMAMANNLAPGTTYYFAVTAYDALGNLGAPSTEVNFTTTNVPTTVTNVPPATNTNSAAGNLSMQMANDGQGSAIISFFIQPGHWYSLQASADLKNWSTIWQVSTSSAATTVWHTDTPPPGVTYTQRFYRYVIN